MTFPSWFQGVLQSFIAGALLRVAGLAIHWSLRTRPEGFGFRASAISAFRGIRFSYSRQLWKHLLVSILLGAGLYLGWHGVRMFTLGREHDRPSMERASSALPSKWQRLWNDALADSNVAADLAEWRASRVVRAIDFDTPFPHLLYHDIDDIGEERLVTDPDNEENQVQWVHQWTREGITTALYDAATWKLQGKRIVVVARLRTRGIVRKNGNREDSWMWGGKFMLQFGSGDTTYWEVANTIYPEADWHVRVLEQDDAKGKNRDNVPEATSTRPHHYIIGVPDDAKDCQIHLGLRDAEGEIWFDDLAIFEVARLDRVTVK